MTYQQYIEEVKRIPRFSHSEQRALAYKMREGDQEAERKLIECNLRFVIKIAITYLPQINHSFLEDLIQEGNMGLMHAIQTYNPDFGFTVPSYVVSEIRSRIIKYIIKDTVVTVPKSQNKIAKTIEELAKKIDIPEDQDKEDALVRTVAKTKGIHDYSAIDIDKILRRKEISKPCSLNEVIFKEEDTELIDLLTKKYVPNPYEVISHDFDHNYFMEHINEAMALLPPRGRAILERRLGINNEGEIESLESIGETYGISKQRVKQIEKETLKKLRKLIPDRVQKELGIHYEMLMRETDI